MPSSKVGLSVADESKYVAILFFLFAAQIMSWVPRFPEVKTNLQISNGEFGTYLSFGGIGSIVALTISGHLVHKYGTKIVLIFSAIGMCLAISIIVHLHSTPIFIVLQVVNGLVISAFNVAINAQAFHAQDRAGVMIMSRQHGYWTLGAVLTAVLSGILVSFVSLALHINILSAILFVAIVICIKKLNPELIKQSTTDEHDFGVKDLFTSFRIDGLVSIAFICAILLEFATADWSAIYARESIGVNGALATLPYIAAFSAMIIGRFSIHKVTPHISLEKLVKIGSLVGGFGFIGFILGSSMLVDYSKNLAFSCAVLAFAIGGLGSSILSPTIFTAANQRSNQNSGVIVGQMLVVNAVLALILKTIIAWTAQFTGSVAIALVIPGLMLVSVAFMSRVVKGI